MNIKVGFEENKKNIDLKFGSNFEGIAGALLNSKVDKSQGAENAGKVLGIGNDGIVTPANMPKKLTDLENDLYYAKEKLVCGITKNDFVVNENIGFAGYEIEPMVEGLTPDNFTIKIHAVLGEETSDIEFAHNTFKIYANEESNLFLAQHNEPTVFLTNGIAFTDEGEELKNATCIYLAPGLLNEGEVTLSLVLIDAKKVPKEIVPVEELPVVRTDNLQDLTDEQQGIARENIGAAGIEFENAVSNAVYNGNQQSIPIVKTSQTGPEYTVTIPTLSGKPPEGFLFVVIPHKSNDNYEPKIIINGEYTYNILRISDTTTGSNASIYKKGVISAYEPILLLVTDNTNNLLKLINFTGYSYKQKSQYSTCTTEAATRVKVASTSYFLAETGSVLYVKFKYTNTSTNPYLTTNSMPNSYKITDRMGNNIESNSLQEGIVYQFLFTGNTWVLMD